MAYAINQQKRRSTRPAKIAARLPACAGNFQLQQIGHGKKVVLLY
jgi:hypothetical protein